MLSNICVCGCKCVCTPESSFPLADHFQPPPPPRTISLSAGNVILGKPDSHYLCFLLASLQVIPLRISNLLTQAESCIYNRWPPLFNTCYRLGGYYHINAALHSWGHKKKEAWMASFSNPTLIPLSLLPTLSSTPHFLVFFPLPCRICYVFLYFFWPPSTLPIPSHILVWCV